MNNKQQRLAEKCANIEPLEGRILVCPNKVRTYKFKGVTSRPVDPNVSEAEIIEGETEMILEEVMQDANYRFQTGVVVKLAKEEDRFEIGDTVVFDLGALQEFDLVKGVSVLRRFDAQFFIKAV